jgi:NAD(P)-dependent dehydrogenase (short-subunit alcohol dehydrogenase family)
MIMASGRLAGKTALVTGSTRGLGRTMAEWLAKEGANIIVSGRDETPVQAAVEGIKALGVDATGIPADLARIEDAHRLAEEAQKRVPKIDILVNNAGMSTRKSFWDYTDEDWDYQVNVNVRSPFILAQQLAKHFMEHQTRGRIVNISTIGVHACHADAAIYNLAKAGVETMTQNMAFELAPYGISVNCVAPGNMADRPGTKQEAWWGPAARMIPFGRVGTADDIAAAVLFFCLPESEFTTGQTLLVDGGHDSYLAGVWPDAQIR